MKPNQGSTMEPFRKNSFRLLAVNFFALNTFVDVQVGSKYFSEKNTIFFIRIFGIVIK